jgi:4-amino-4-deoxy-L-arabinose transferase-like glycosyltransferase
MTDLLGWAAILLVIPAAHPLAKACLARSPLDDGRALTWSLAAALGVSILTQIMFWMSLLGVRYSVGSIGLIYVAVVVGAAWVIDKRGVGTPPAGTSSPFRAQSPFLASAASNTPNHHHKQHFAPRTLFAIALAIIAAAVLFNAVYFPFTRDDVVALYHPFAQQMARDGVLIPLIGAESLHRMYPMQIPLAFTFAYLAAGWDNEYLARLLPALLALGCLPAAWLLGRKLAGDGAGWLAALLVGITPTFGSWASTGYTELPMAFLLALGVLFAIRLSERGAAMDAALAGVCIGLATWTKNSALLAVPPLVVWFGWVLLRKRASWRALLLGLALCALVGAPWYLRNLLVVGDLLPDTAWVDQARRTLDSLLIFVTLPDNFGVPGWAMLAGIAWAVWGVATSVVAWRKRTTNGASALNADETHAPLALLLWIVPFFSAWWWFASYDPRFLASLVPLTCALGGATCWRVWSWLPDDVRRIAAPTLAVVAIALALLSAYTIVEYKDDILRNPLMTHEEKMALVDARRNGR